MTTQTEMFPKTELDQAHAVLSHLFNEEEKAETAVDNAERKLSECQTRVYKQRQVISYLQAKMPAVDIEFAETIEDGELVDDDHRIEGDVLDPITGEVTRLVTCTECQGEGRLEDKTGGGHHKCKACDGSGRVEIPSTTMLVAWPDNPDMQRLEVGPLTRYGELAARFLNSLPSDDPRRGDAFTDYRIVDVDAGSERDPHTVIDPSDYALEFSVEAPAVAEESAA